MIAKGRILTITILSISFFSTFVLAGSFRQEREKFRKEINNKKEQQIDSKGLFSAVMFDKDQGKWNFNVKSSDNEKIKKELSEYFSCNDNAILERMVNEMKQGGIIVYKEYLPKLDGVNLKTAFLSPKVPYWEYLNDINGIEKLFHVYNFSVEVGKRSQLETYVILQTQGTFMGFTKAVTLPVFFSADYKNRTLHFKMPTQQEITEAVKKLPVLNPGRESLEERFIDACRTHPFFQEKDAKGNYIVSDEEILKILNDIILQMDKKCDVYETVGRWAVDESYDDYYLVTYSLRSVVNIKAFIPPNIPLLGPMFKKIAQMVSDEVSAKYLPLSMKNFRDHTVAWAKRG